MAHTMMIETHNGAVKSSDVSHASRSVIVALEEAKDLFTVSIQEFSSDERQDDQRQTEQHRLLVSPRPPDPSGRDSGRNKQRHRNGHGEDQYEQGQHGLIVSSPEENYTVSRTSERA